MESFNNKSFWENRFTKFNKLSSGYTDEIIQNFDNRIRWKSFIREVKLNKEDKILDIGCNHGLWSIKLAKLGMDVTGIDIISEAIDIAKKNAAKASLNISFKEMKAEDIDFKPNSFDKIISITVMQHILHDDLFIKTLYKYNNQLKQNGLLILMESASNKTKAENLRYKRERTLKTHLNLCKEAGFKLIKIRGVGHLSVRFYYAIDYFIKHQKIKQALQLFGLKILNPIDIFLARYFIFTKYSNLKLMLFKKI
tara:strand:+ start:976 stop:1734 length:759 start_codon:yes stop_codon:yes gene_type:complete